MIPANHNRIALFDDYYLFNCPHCDDMIQVQKNQVNCKIFRHAIYKSDYTQINPHSNLEECTRLKNSNLVFGCAKPFILDIPSMSVSICDYY